MVRYCYICETEVELIEDSASNAGLCSICGTVLLRSASKLSPGTMLNGFQIIEEIGRGGMGIVYRANQMNLDREVAVKVLADDLANDEEFVSNFFREARAAASLNHQNIVQVYDAGMTPEGIYYFVMELIDGETIEQKLDREVSLDPDEAVQIALKISEALNYAWKTKQLTHGDIKPDNIILNRDGSVKLADLGLAKCVHEEFSASGIMATPLYAPPEVIKSQFHLIGFRSDMYSLGVTLFQMLAGTPPFPNDSTEAVLEKHLNEIPPSLHSYNPRLARKLVDLVKSLLEKEPSSRPSSWQEVCMILEQIDEGEPSVHHSEHHKVFRGVHGHKQMKQNNSPGKLVDTPVQEKKKGGLVKKVIILAVIVIVVFAGLVFIDKVQNNSESAEKTQKNQEGLEFTDLSPDKKESVVTAYDRFEHLKVKLKTLPLNKQISELEIFIKEEKNKAPQKAVELLIELKKKMRVAENNKKQDKFGEKIQRLFNFADEIKDGDFSKLQEVRKNLKKVNNMLNQVHSKKYLADNKSFLQDLKHIQDILQGYCNGYEKLQAEKRRAEQDAKQKLIDAARAVDGYYAILASYLQNKNLDQFKKSLKSWIENREELPDEYRKRSIFLISVLDDLKSVSDLIFKNSKILVGKKLPVGICPEKYREFKIKKVTKVGMVFASSNGKVIIEKKLKWSKFGTKRIIALISELYLTRKSGISKETFNSFMIFLLLKQPELIRNISDKIRYPDEMTSLFWSQLSFDFQNAERENSASEHFSKLVNMFENGNISQASEYYHFVKKEIEPTEFKKRHFSEIKLLAVKLFSLSPEMMSKKAISELEQMHLSAENTGHVMVAQARFWNILKNDDRKKIMSMKSSCLRELTSEQNLTSAYHCAPFYKWSQESDGCALAYFKFLDKSGIFEKNQDVRAGFELAASVQIGDWKRVKELFPSFSLNVVHKVLKNNTHIEWGVSIAFAYGVAASRFGNPGKAFAALKLIRQVLNRKTTPELRALYTSLAIELAMITGRNNFALEIGKQYKYKAGPLLDIETRIVMLSLFVLLESREVNVKRIEDIYSHVLRKNMKLRSDHFDDRIWCDIALEIVKGNVTARRLKELEQTRCKYKDIAVRIIMAAFSRNFYQSGGSDENKIRQILKIADNNIGRGFYASLSREKFLLLKGGLTDNVAELRDVFIEAMKDYSVSGIYHYPEQLVFLNTCDYIDGLFNQEKTVNSIEQYCVASLVAPESFKNLSRILFNDKRNKMIGKMIKDGAYFQGYICVILGKMLYYKDRRVLGELNNIYRKSETHYSWSEKMFMRNLDKIIENRGN